MRESTRRAAAERKADHRPPDAIQAYGVTTIRLTLAASDQHIEHAKLSRSLHHPIEE
jgi:hypothetical protein